MPRPDYEQFLKVLWRQGQPDHLPFYEHIASPGFVSRRMGVDFERMTRDQPEYWRVYVDFWLGMGYDVVPLESSPLVTLSSSDHADGAKSHRSESTACIRSLDDFERYAWPSDEAPINFRDFEMAAACLPDGAKIVGGVAAGPFEWATYFMGVEGLALAVHDNPELVRLVFARIGQMHLAANRQLATMDCICALRQGDDLGFKTSTFLRPDTLRRHVFPLYKQMADNAHAHGKPFILHSCGNLDDVYEDLIACGIDAKHSFEEAILPVEDYKARYGDRMTPLGGLDVDMICRADEPALRAYARDKIEKCFADGYWALGTGNSLTNYMPVENYLIVLDEARRVVG